MMFHPSGSRRVTPRQDKSQKYSQQRAIFHWHGGKRPVAPEEKRQFPAIAYLAGKTFTPARKIAARCRRAGRLFGA
jgi:hypothetical protein